MKTVNNINNLTVTEQVRNLPTDVVEELKSLFESGEITMAMMLVMLQEKGLIADGVKYKTFHGAMTRVHKFKQYQSHGFLAESEGHMRLWDWAKNEEEGLNPEELTLKSAKAAWFKCPHGLHPSQKRTIHGHVSGHSCSKCRYEAQAEARAVPKKGRSLADMYPLVASEFDAAGNEVSSKDVAAKSHKVFAFNPSCGHELHRPYKQMVKDRTVNEDNWIKNGHTGSWCPWCSNKMKSSLHAEVCEYISSLIPLGTGIDALVNQMILPHDDSLPDGVRQPNEIDFLSHDLKLAIEIHGHSHDQDPEYYTPSKAKRAEELGLDFFVIWEKDWEIPEKREYLKEQLKVIIGFKVMDYLKKQARAVSGVFWAGESA